MISAGPAARDGSLLAQKGLRFPPRRPAHEWPSFPESGPSPPDPSNAVATPCRSGAPFQQARAREPAPCRGSRWSRRQSLPTGPCNRVKGPRRRPGTSGPSGARTAGPRPPPTARCLGSRQSLSRASRRRRRMPRQPPQRLIVQLFAHAPPSQRPACPPMPHSHDDSPDFQSSLIREDGNSFAVG